MHWVVSLQATVGQSVPALPSTGACMQSKAISIQPVTAKKTVPAMPSTAMQSSAIAIQPVSAMLMTVTEQVTASLGQ